MLITEATRKQTRTYVLSLIYFLHMAATLDKTVSSSFQSETPYRHWKHKEKMESLDSSVEDRGKIMMILRKE